MEDLLYVDYGIETLYVADFVRIFVSPFVEVTHGTLIFVFRCIHLLAWIGSIIALWRLVGRHFGKGWQQILAVTLLVVRPAFPYLLNNSNADIPVLFFIIIGLDYSLRIIDKPNIKSFCIAIVCATMGFVIKYYGLLLLPAIALALYFSRYYHDKNYYRGVNSIFTHEIKKAYLLPALIGVSIILFTLIPILVYVRGSTGITLYEELGIWGSLKEKKLILWIWLIGIFFIVTSFVFWRINKQNILYWRKIGKVFNELNTYSIIVCGAFFITTFLLSLRLLVNLNLFILECAQFGSLIDVQAGLIEKKGLFHVLLHNVVNKLATFDVIIFSFFMLYLGMEFYNRQQHMEDASVRLVFLKRMVLLVFLIVPFLYMLTPYRMEKHNMLAFFAITVILVNQGITLFIISLKRKKILQKMIIFCFVILFVGDVVVNAATVIKERMRAFNQQHDVAYEIADWWLQHITKDTMVVADHQTRVYVPTEHKNIKYFRSYKKVPSKEGFVEELYRLVNEYHPKYVYLNEGSNGRPTDNETWPSMNEMLPDKTIKQIKVFESTGRRYQRHPDDKFVFYEIFYW
ncbi:MAG: glycosyltransferase family 39 protein [Candidatus Brocadiaceae bacterium]|nr:glycosyltransferase family 39 protein [Candidatus Brocadiaceae bacterium]